MGDPVPPARGSAAPLTLLVRTRRELADALSGAPGPRAVVMTMGALHEGHLDLVREASRRVGRAGTLVVTVFVNPLQFGAGEDFEAYPRDLDGDLAGLARALGGVGTGADEAVGAGADADEAGEEGGPRVGRLVVFAPAPQEVYPGGRPQVRIDPGPVGAVLEGRTRPTHFAGVCQVVLTLLHLTGPRWALFGRKDAQQLAIVQAMVKDLAVPVEIVPVDTRRQADGLAMSSRNAYLSPEGRKHALALPQALEAARDAAAAGAGPSAVREAAQEILDTAPGVRPDYAALVDPDTFTDLAGAGLGLPPTGTQADQADGTGQWRGHTGSAAGEQAGAPPGRGLLAVAAWVGSTRLIDNTVITLAGRGRAVRPGGGTSLGR